MNQNIKVAVIGGTGKSGKYLVKELLHRGFQIKIFLRNPAHFQSDSSLVEVVNGNVTDASSIDSLLQGCQAVISTLGLGTPPSEPTIFSQSTAHVLEAMKKHAIGRYILTTGLNVDTPFDQKSPKTAFATEWMKQNYPISTTNKQLEYEFLVHSEVDWTLVRLPMIEQTDQRGQVKVSLEDCEGDKISATDLADFLILQLTDTRFIRKAPFIATV